MQFLTMYMRTLGVCLGVDVKEYEIESLNELNLMT